MNIRTIASLVAAAKLFSPLVAFAQQAPSFADVPATHPAFLSVEHLKSKGLMTGNDNGTFAPDTPITRAAALAVVVRSQNPGEALSAYKDTVFGDIKADDWYLPHAEYGRQKMGIVTGPPQKTTFEGGKTVTKAEAIKWILSAYKENLSILGESKPPLSRDVANTKEWYYPYMLAAVRTSMTMISGDGLFHPEKKLTRGEFAMLLSRYLYFGEKLRTQALLSEAENEILNIINSLGKNDVASAEFAYGRAYAAAQGAYQSRPTEDLVRAALKITESFGSLVLAFKAVLVPNYDEVIAQSKDAWAKAEKAKAFVDPGSEGRENVLATIKQVQENASQMAASARQAKSQ